jgi:prefoldin subunit 5
MAGLYLDRFTAPKARGLYMNVLSDKLEAITAELEHCAARIFALQAENRELRELVRRIQSARATIEAERTPERH